VVIDSEAETRTECQDLPTADGLGNIPIFLFQRSTF